MSVRIITGDCRDILPTFDANSFDCVVTSPPYWGLRDYGVAGQIGLEPTLGEYLETMVGVFRELRRVLKPTGTCWLNIGDSYATLGGGGKQGSSGQRATRTYTAEGSSKKGVPDGLKAKDLCMVPNRLAILLQEDGWWVRSEIIWHKLNPMPESVTDRPTCAHEKLWLLTKSGSYAYDAAAIAESAVSAHKSGNGYGRSEQLSREGRGAKEPWDNIGGTRSARNVWTTASEPYRGTHYAVMPSALAERCIKAGCPERVCQNCGAPHSRVTERTPVSLRPNSDSIRGSSPSSSRAAGGNPQRGSVAVHVESMGFEPTCKCYDVFVAGSVLDPFGGAGTTGLVADRIGRHATLIELNPANREMAAERVTMDGPLFAEVGA